MSVSSSKILINGSLKDISSPTPHTHMRWTLNKMNAYLLYSLINPETFEEWVLKSLENLQRSFNWVLISSVICSDLTRASNVSC